jgi:hypothetical protein
MGKAAIGAMQVGYASDGTPMEVHVSSSITGIKTTYKMDPAALSPAERENLLAEIRNDLKQQGGYHLVVERLEKASIAAEIRNTPRSENDPARQAVQKIQSQLQAARPNGVEFGVQSGIKQARAYTLEALQGRHTLGVYSKGEQELELQKGPGNSYYCLMRQGASEFSYRLNMPPESAVEKLKLLAGIFAEEKNVADPSRNLAGGKLGRLLAFDPDASIAGGKGLYLKGTNFIGRAMRSAEFESCVFDSCFAIKARAQAMRCTACTFIDLRADGANFEGASFIRCTFKGHTILKGANLSRMNWVDSELAKRNETSPEPTVDARGANARGMESSAALPESAKEWLGRKAADIPLIGSWLSKRLGYAERESSAIQKIGRQFTGLIFTENCASLHSAPGMLERCSSEVKNTSLIQELDKALKMDYSSLVGKLRASGVLELQRGGSRIELVEKADHTGFLLRDRQGGVFASVACIEGRTDKAVLTLYKTPNDGTLENSEVGTLLGKKQQAKLTFDQLLTGLVHYCNNGGLQIVKRGEGRGRVFKVGSN